MWPTSQPHTVVLQTIQDQFLLGMLRERIEMTANDKIVGAQRWYRAPIRTTLDTNSSTRSHQVVDDVRVVVDCLVHHKAQDTHLSRAAVVELDCLAGQTETTQRR